jgi:HTH-type transcriptional regulator/antitoxin HigA
MHIKPIKSEADYEEALKEISRLFAAQAGTGEHDSLDVLTTLVEDYEAKQHPVYPPDPIAAIEYEAEKRGLTRKQLAAVIGPSGRVSEVLNKRRPLSINMVRNLRNAFGISADILINAYPIAAPSSNMPTGPLRGQREANVSGAVGRSSKAKSAAARDISNFRSKNGSIKGRRPKSAPSPKKDNG